MLIHRLNKRKSIFFALSLLLLSGVNQASENYSQGLKAYLEGKFELAQSLWLKAAEEGDAKSMFNLGLLHEQRKIRVPQSDKAENWYRLAGQHGYVAADYHLAMKIIARGGDQTDAERLIDRAAKRGFALAIDYRQHRDESFASQPLTGESAEVQKEYLTEEWISSKTPDEWTIQMLAFKDLQKVQDFIDQHRLHTKVAYFTERSGKDVLYKLIYGAYASKVQADSARQRLPNVLKKHGPWLRPIASVQAVIGAQ